MMRPCQLTSYPADHVFEAQTLGHFITWLADEDPAKVGTTYDKPSAAWVNNKVLGIGQNPFKIVKPGKTQPGDLFTPSTGEVPVTLMAYGFGRSDGVKSVSGGQNVERIPADRGNNNLVLLNKYINKAKGTWFEKKTLQSDWKAHKDQDESRVEVRRVSTTRTQASKFTNSL